MLRYDYFLEHLWIIAHRVFNVCYAASCWAANRRRQEIKKNNADLLLLEAQLLSRVSLTDSVNPSLTDNVYLSCFGIFEICGSIWTFFTILPPRI